TRPGRSRRRRDATRSSRAIPRRHPSRVPESLAKGPRIAVGRSNRPVLLVLSEITHDIDTVLVHFLSLFLPLEIEAPESEWILLPKRAAAFREDTGNLRQCFR